jgi:hypothetical protein
MYVLTFRSSGRATAGFARFRAPQSKHYKGLPFFQGASPDRSSRMWQLKRPACVTITGLVGRVVSRPDPDGRRGGEPQSLVGMYSAP